MVRKFLFLSLIAAVLIVGIGAFALNSPTPDPNAVSLAPFVPTTAAAPTSAVTTNTASDDTTSDAPADAVAANDNDNGKTLATANEGLYTLRVVPDQTKVEYAVDEVLFGNKQITRGSTNAVE